MFVQEHGVALLAWSSLQWERNQIPEPAVREGVLVRKEAIVRVEANVWPRLHRLRQQMRPEATSQRCRQSILEEQPDVGTPSRPGALERRRKVEARARLQEPARVGLPTSLVKVDGEQVAGLVQQQRIHAGNERLAVRAASRQMPADHVISDREEPTMGAVGAFDARLLANATDPLVSISARGRIAAPACLAALEAARVHVDAAAEQRPEQRDLCLGRGRVGDRAQIHWRLWIVSASRNTSG